MNIKELKIFGLSCVFIICAFLTISYSYSKGEDYNTSSNWNVYIDDVTLSNVNYNNTRIDFNIDLRERNEYEFSFLLTNAGKIDAVLKKIIGNDSLKKEVYNDGVNTYYLSDFIDYKLTYLTSKEEVTIGDILKSNSGRNIVVTFKIKDVNDVRLNVIDRSKFKFDYGIYLDYQQIL